MYLLFCAITSDEKQKRLNEKQPVLAHIHVPTVTTFKDNILYPFLGGSLMQNCVQIIRLNLCHFVFVQYRTFKEVQGYYNFPKLLY